MKDPEKQSEFTCPYCGTTMLKERWKSGAVSLSCLSCQYIFFSHVSYEDAYSQITPPKKGTN